MICQAFLASYLELLYHRNILRRKIGKIMSDTYVECLIKAKQALWAKFGVVFLVVLTVLFTLSMFVFFAGPLFALATGACAYFLNMYTNLEYEYLYLDKEIVIDKVLAKSKRKRVATYSVESMEVMAPVNSYHLDNYKNRSVKVKDYSIGEVRQPDLRYVMYCEGGQKVLISPSEEMVKAIKNIAPRKVFTD